MFLWTIIGAVSIFGITCTQGKCDCAEFTVHYEELGCTPNYANSNDCCPSWYTCELESRQTGRQCYFAGIVYAPGQRLNELRMSSPCYQKCKCDGVGSVNFKCSHKRCPEETQTVGCYLKYRTDSCCSLGSACYPFDATDTCFDGERVSLEGEKYPHPNEPCTECVCEQPRNAGGLQLVCKRKYCATDLLQAENARQFCAPVYDTHESCCPLYWKCPQSADKIVRGPSNVHPTDRVCHFGNTDLNVGDTINGMTIDIDNLQCVCRIPPFVTCVKKDSKLGDWSD